MCALCFIFWIWNTLCSGAPSLWCIVFQPSGQNVYLHKYCREWLNQTVVTFACFRKFILCFWCFVLNLIYCKECLKATTCIFYDMKPVFDTWWQCVEEVFTAHILTLFGILVLRNLDPSKTKPVEEILFMCKKNLMTMICKASFENRGRRMMLPTSDSQCIFQLEVGWLYLFWLGEEKCCKLINVKCFYGDLANKILLRQSSIRDLYDALDFGNSVCRACLTLGKRFDKLFCLGFLVSWSSIKNITVKGWVKLVFITLLIFGFS